MQANKKNIEGMSNKLPTKIDPWYVRTGWTIFAVVACMVGPIFVGLACGLIYRLFLMGWRIVA